MELHHYLSVNLRVFKKLLISGSLKCFFNLCCIYFVITTVGKSEEKKYAIYTSQFYINTLIYIIFNFSNSKIAVIEVNVFMMRFQENNFLALKGLKLIAEVLSQKIHFFVINSYIRAIFVRVKSYLNLIKLAILVGFRSVCLCLQISVYYFFSYT